ncbi:hypothetical protein M378DRAFT_333055 [Amanita muscaria Koide BX008]|uniref:NAD(P)-binding protein n=1 Tax=Amanita muscaria (strain Koide BX008) TaxID=946122 RepID=A0A0C2SW27_AMAMK|nr:hypothetical protein M378DRAFT_333055 [Amanita muscaria Koide BX008]
MTSDLSSLSALKLFDLHDYLAIVTGAHGGIGLQIATAYAEAGAMVYGIDKVEQKNGDRWDEAKKRVAKQNNDDCMKYLQGDVTDMGTMEKLVKEIREKEKGRLLDICVACAGTLHPDDSIHSSSEDFEKIMKTNVSGMFCTAKVAYDAMKRENGKDKLKDPKWRKSIIFIASMSGSVANKGMNWIAYNASKAAVVQMARSMACSKEFSEEGIRVNSISPGYIRTEMVEKFLQSMPEMREEISNQNPMKRIGEPDELRGVALWLAGKGSTFCTGSDIRVDGGHCAW